LYLYVIHPVVTDEVLKPSHGGVTTASGIEEIPLLTFKLSYL